MNDLLSEEQKKKIIELWNSRPENPPSLLEIIREAFPDKEIDGRSKEGRAVKRFLATRKIKAKRAHEHTPKDVSLSEEQKEYITKVK